MTTTLALVWGTIAVGDERVSPVAAVVLGIANLLATGMSMGIGDYVGTVAEHEAMLLNSPGPRIDDHEGSKRVKASALRSGLTMFLSFIVFGSLPLMAYLPLFGDVTIRRVVSTIFCFISFFSLGYVRGVVSGVSTVRSALTMMFMGSSAAFVSFAASKLIFWMLVGDEEPKVVT